MAYCPVCGGKLGFFWGRCKQCGRKPALERSEGAEERPDPPANVLSEWALGLVLDRSGSMSRIGAEEIAGSANSFIAEQVKAGVQARIEVICFDSHVDVLRRLGPLATVGRIAADEVRPRGMTALYDAVGKAIGTLTGKAARTILTVVTDGLENASREWTHERMKEALDDLQANHGWQVAWVGSDPAVVNQGVSAGVFRGQAAQYTNTAAGYKVALQAVSANAVSCRVGRSETMGFSDEQRKKLLNADDTADE